MGPKIPRHVKNMGSLKVSEIEKICGCPAVFLLGGDAIVGVSPEQPLGRRGSLYLHSAPQRRRLPYLSVIK